MLDLSQQSSTSGTTLIPCMDVLRLFQGAPFPRNELDTKLNQRFRRWIPIYIMYETPRTILSKGMGK